MEFKNEMEKTIAKRAVKKYREKQAEYKYIKKLLSTKKFKYGDYVVKKGTSYFDGVFNTGSGSIGKVIWFDEEWGYYRVRYDSNASWVGTREEDIETYTGEIPQHLKDYDIEDLTHIQFTVAKNKTV